MLKNIRDVLKEAEGINGRIYADMGEKTSSVCRQGIAIEVELLKIQVLAIQADAMDRQAKAMEQFSLDFSDFLIKKGL